MSDVFSFKSFSVKQDRCSMKVCTDSCILGAFASSRMIGSTNEDSRIMDIGSGTGLLSLMVAQKNKGIIDAIEIDAAAADQSKENIQSSPFRNITVHNESILDFKISYLYDFIIVNPPFYEDSLKSPDKRKNDAMHSLQLTLEKLLATIKSALSPSGTAFILLPFPRTGETETSALRKGLHVQERLLIRHSDSHPFTRTILSITHFGSTIENETELSIRDKMGNYSADFIGLLKDYYLYL